MPVVKIPIRAELWALSVIILIGAFMVSPGFTLVDEAIYYLGARAISEWGALGISNYGFEQFQSESLKLRLLVDGPQGLTPQYPAGSALLAAPLLPMLGARAFILLNAVAAVLVLFTVWKICLSQFKSETVARIAVALLVMGTFWGEYAVGIWPHMVSTYFAVQAYWFALRHLDPAGNSYRDAILSGLFAGAGMLFRLDAALAVPAIGLILVMFAPRFVRSSCWFGLGVLPSLALASWLSYLKFGTPNPFSYGSSGGNTNVSAYGPYLAALCVGFGALILWRKVEWKIDRKVAITCLVLVGTGLLVIPATNTWLLRFWNGFMALVVDMRTVDDHRFGITPGPGHTLMFWGLVKKALGQSMPWIGLAAILLTSGIPKGDRRFMAMLLVFVATMTMPFILLSWHGGGCSNMRYFLPAVPLLCILCAKLFCDLWQRVPNATIFVAVGVWATVGLCVAWVLLHPSGNAGVQQILSTYLLLATALSAIASGISWRFQQSSRELLIALSGSGFLLSMNSALADFRTAADRRDFSHDVSQAIAGLPARSLIIALPEWTASQISLNGSIVADREPLDRPLDSKLIHSALDQGYRVFTPNYLFIVTRDAPPGVEALATEHKFPGGQMIELRRATGRALAKACRARATRRSWRRI